MHEIQALCCACRDLTFTVLNAKGFWFRVQGACKCTQVKGFLNMVMELKSWASKAGAEEFPKVVQGFFALLLSKLDAAMKTLVDQERPHAANSSTLKPETPKL